MKTKINSLPEKYEDIILPLMNVNPKLVLGGSLALYVLDIMEYDFTNRKPDLDFSLLEPLTTEELASIKDFFNLQYKIGYNDYNIIDENSTEDEIKKITKIKPLEYFLKKDLLQLYKLNNDSELDYTIDFFNSTYLPKKELVIINYKGFELRLSHPSYILSHKSKYAYDNRVGKQFKHFQDLQKIDWKNYFEIIKKFNSNYQQTEDSRYMSITHYSYGLETDNLPF
jgi:hypothetical protein